MTETAGKVRESIEPPDEAVPVQEMVGIEIVPIGPTTDACEGGIVKLTKNEGKPDEFVLAAGLSGTQCRDIALRLLTIADASSAGREVTMVCVTPTVAWKLPGQVLLAKRSPMLTFEFAVKPSSPGDKLMKPNRKLIVP